MAEFSPLAVQGFTIYKAEVVPEKFEILGDDMQFLNVKMAPSDVVTTKPGNMSYMSSNLSSGCNSDQCCGRCMSGNPCCMATYTNNDGAEGYIGLASDLPAKVVPINTATIPSGKMKCKSGTFMASYGDVNLDFDFDCNPATCCFGGQGCVRQKVHGSGMAFLSAMGTIMKKNLAAGETLVVDTNSIVAWEESVELNIRLAGGCCTICCGGEGLFNTTLTGPGDVYIQSYSRERFAAALAAIAGPKNGGGEGGAPATAEEMER